MAVRACACLMLLLVASQLATSKSVDETFKDARYSPRALALSKRAANDESEETTTSLSTDDTTDPDDDDDASEEALTTPVPPSTTTAKPLKTRRQTAKAKRTTTPAPTTPSEDDEEDAQSAEDEVTTTVKPLNKKDKPKSHKKPKPQSPQVLSRIQPDADEEKPDGPKPVEHPVEQPVEQPASNLLPPMPFNSYLPPLPNSFMPPPNPAFAAPWGLGPLGPAPAIPMLPNSAGPYDYPHPSGPAFSYPAGASASAGSFASASASAGANGLGGTVSTSTNPGGLGVQQSSQAFSSSYPNGGTQQSSYIGTRGSFGDDDSVAIGVDGPAAGAGVPAYPSPNYAVSGPGYAAGGAYAPNPYGNAIPSYGPYASPLDFQQLFQQYFAVMQAQQQAFQQQLQAQIQAQQQAGGTFASGGAFITNDQGKVDPSAQVYVNTYSSPTSGSASTSVDSRFGIGGSKSSVVAYPFSNKNSDKSIWDQSNRVDSNFGNGGIGGGSPSSGPQSAIASANLGPRGGFQSAQVSPAAPGIFSRFGEEIPAPSGGQYGVFSSSSSSSSTGPDGKTISQKSATVGVNDNGQISYKTVHDP